MIKTNFFNLLTFTENKGLVADQNEILASILEASCTRERSVIVAELNLSGLKSRAVPSQQARELPVPEGLEISSTSFFNVSEI